MSSGQIPTLLWRHWTLTPGPDALAVLACLIYLSGVKHVRDWPLMRTASFLAGVACVLIALASGIGSYNDALLSDHMVQHLLLLELAPILLLASRPLTLLLRSTAPRSRPSLARRIRGLHPVTHPFSCLAIVWIVVLGTHVPAVYDATLRDPLIHDAEHMLYLITGLIMWWPVLDEDPLPSHRLSGFVRIAYLSAAMLPMTIIGVYLDRNTTLVYAPYAEPAHLLGLSAIVDQQQAGAIMWVIGGSLMGAIGIWRAMAALIAEERRMQTRERFLDRAVTHEEWHG